MKRFIVLLLLLALFASACGSGGVQQQENESSAEPNTESSVESSEDITSSLPEESDESSIIEESSIPEEPSPEPELPDILPLITDHGKEIKGYGDLEGIDFSQLQEKLNSYDYNISFVIYSVDNSKAISYNTSARLFCASAIKAPFALFACEAMEELSIPLDREVVYKSEHYETGTGDLQYEPIGSAFTLETIIGKAMSISDNVGYLMTVDYFGRDNYNLWAEDKGYDSLKIAPTVWSLKASALDFAAAWGDIYDYFATDSEYAKFLYDSCTNTKGNFATQMLNVEYSHKQGHNRSDGWHSYTDAGIVWQGDQSYIFAIISDIPGPNSTGENMMNDIMTVADGLFKNAA